MLENEDVLYSVKEVAKLIKTNPGFVYELIKRGFLPALKLGSLKVRRASLNEFLKTYEGFDLSNLDNVVALKYQNQK
jgi:DNA binding domain, excisionase family